MELSATHKSSIKKDALAPFNPRTDVSLDAQGLSILQRWLAVRYRRAAFPDEFDRRLSAAKMPHRIEKAIKKAGKHVVAVFFDVDGGKGFLHNGSDDPYLLGINLMYDASQNEAEAASQSAADEIENVFTKEFQIQGGKWKDIQLEYCDVISDHVMTYRDAHMFKQWRLEHISLKDEAERPIFIED